MHLCHGVFNSPLAGGLHGVSFVCLPVLSDVVVQRIFRIGRRKKSLNAQKGNTDLQGGGPRLLEGVKADTAKAIHVRVVNAGDETALRRVHRISLGKEELKLELAAFIRAVLGTAQIHVEITDVLWIGNSSDARSYKQQKQGERRKK